jgi:vancomycin permeability regulator SanA
MNNIETLWEINENIKFSNEKVTPNEKITSNEKVKYIIVLAGGINENGEVNSFVKKRLDIAIKIYHQYKNIKIICVGGGTYHKSPFLNSNKFVVHEATACAYYLVKKNVKQTDIYKEWSSFDTIANGFFTFLNFIIPLDIKNITIITSQFHMNRTKEIFNYFNNIFQKDINITYISSDNKDINNDVLTLRIKREEESRKNFIKNIVERKKKVKSFLLWFYTEHNAYKSIRYNNDNHIDKNLKKTY